MPKIYTSFKDETLIDSLIRKGLGSQCPKWTVLRIALAISLQIKTEPDAALDKRESSGSEYSYEQLTGEGHEKDFTDQFCALLSTYHQTNLFDDSETFRVLLQRHVRRGLREIGSSWTESHNFHEYLYQELFSSIIETPENKDLRPNLEMALKEIGISAEIKDEILGPRVTRFHTFLQNINELDKLKRSLNKISFYLGLGQKSVFDSPTSESKTIGLDVPRPQSTWQVFDGKDLISWTNRPPKGLALPIWLGVDALGEPTCVDLAEAPHLLVGGTTGSGKSVCLHSIILSLLYTNSTDKLTLCLIDPKYVEFSSYNALPNLYRNSVITDASEALSVLNDLVIEMTAREQLFADLGVLNYEEANKLGKSEIPPRIVVFVEELADLVMQNSDIEAPLVRLSQKARAVGIHIVLATQRPDSNTFSGLLRSNIPSRIALAVQKSSESKIIIDEVGAERLMGNGDMLFKPLGEEIKRVHGTLIKRDDIALCLKSIL